MLSCYKSFLDCVWSPFRLQLSHILPQDYRHFWCRCNSEVAVKSFPALSAILGMSHFSCLVVSVLNKSPKETKFSSNLSLQPFLLSDNLFTYNISGTLFYELSSFLPRTLTRTLLSLIQLSLNIYVLYFKRGTYIELLVFPFCYKWLKIMKFNKRFLIVYEVHSDCSLLIQLIPYIATCIEWGLLNF